MPSKSKAQEATMAAAAHDSAFAERMHIPQNVAREFNQADKAAGKRQLPGHVAEMHKHGLGHMMKEK